jgi:hypothetical protein
MRHGGEGWRQKKVLSVGGGVDAKVLARLFFVVGFVLASHRRCFVSDSTFAVFGGPICDSIRRFSYGHNVRRTR